MSPRRSLRLAQSRSRQLLHQHPNDSINDVDTDDLETDDLDTGDLDTSDLDTGDLDTGEFDTGEFDIDNCDTDSQNMEGTVVHRNYRWDCLEPNGIFVLSPNTPLPLAVATYIKQLQAIQQAVKQAAQEGIQQADQAAEAVILLNNLGLETSEPRVVRCLEQYIFPPLTAPPTMQLARIESLPMPRHLLPQPPSPNHLPVSQPRPNMLYGYPVTSLSSLFDPAQHLAIHNLDPQIRNYARVRGLVFPFLIVECKAAASTQGSLWVAANQCAGASAACLQVIDRLNQELAQHDANAAEPVANLCYSIAIDNNLAQLYVAWKDTQNGGRVYMQRIQSFLLDRVDELLALRRRIEAILDWAFNDQPGGRLYTVRGALDSITQTRQTQGAS